MKRITLPLVVAFSVFFTKSNAQVGVNTQTPASTLDIVAKNPSGATANIDGLLIPRVDRLRAQTMSGVPVSTLIYVNDIATGTQTGSTANVDAVGYYYSDGAVWVKLHNPTNSTFSSVNIYNTDGSLTGNRLVTQGTNTLAFTSNAVNGFSVDGSTFSIDALNNRVGIGTAAPNGQLELGQTTANRKLVLYGSFNNDHQFYGFGVNSGILRYQADVTGTDHVFYAGTSATTSNELFRIKGTGNVGVGTSTPQNKLHINGNLQVTNELNVGGNATTTGSAGTAGQVLTSAGTGIAPTWQTPAANLNIYNSDGSLTGNRLVTQGTNTLAFTSNAVNGFSVDGSTFSVDALNNRVGIGTSTPNAPLQMAAATASRKIVMYDVSNNDNQFYGFGVNPGAMRYQADATTTDHIFYAGANATTSNELMRVKGNGNVGIGTASPEVRLHVASSTSASNRFNLIDALEGTTQNVVLALRNTSPVATGNYSLLGFTNAGPTSGGAAWGMGSVRTGATGVASEEEFFVGNSLGGTYLERLRITSAGKVGIGTPTPNGKLTISGSGAGITPMLTLTNTNVAGNPTLNIYPGFSSSGTAISEGNQYAVVFDQDPGTTSGGTIGLFDFHGQVRSISTSTLSDRRLKKDIVDLNEYGIAQVMKLQPKRYIMKEHNNPDVGFIAQELKAVIPEVVYGDEEKGLLSVDYSKVSLVLVNAIKEQQKLIEEQSRQIKELQADVKALKANK